MNKKNVKIRVALDSIIYAPLYTFVQQNSINSEAPFRFYIEAVHQNIDLHDDSNLRSLGPIRNDPVFSPVCDKDRFDMTGNRDSWFGVGDPLRVVRLAQYRGEKISYHFLGTLVSRLAFWIISEEKCLAEHLSPERAKNFNYVACHSRGMTGYYIAETLFKNECNNPLAPVYLPGKEVQQVFRMLKVDWPRRTESKRDPVWMAAVSTEIGKMLNLRSKYHNEEHPIQIEHLNDITSGEVFPNEPVSSATMRANVCLV